MQCAILLLCVIPLAVSGLYIRTQYGYHDVDDIYRRDPSTGIFYDPDNDYDDNEHDDNDYDDNDYDPSDRFDSDYYDPTDGPDFDGNAIFFNRGRYNTGVGGRHFLPRSRGYRTYPIVRRGLPSSRSGYNRRILY
ncbi:uncharacterized protein [Littorina saxatilis]|uniref:Uncharacterized protein n=1 Tax=Littorina saxatilis TaxID=31220 RepID=A0AAN9AKH9_9CAEN